MCCVAGVKEGSSRCFPLIAGGGWSLRGMASSGAFMANGRCYQGRAVVGVDADEVVVAAARVMAGTSMGPRELLLEVVARSLP